MKLTYDFTAEEIIEAGRIERRDIELIKLWMKSIFLPNATDEQITLFLLSCENDLENTKTTILSYYHCMYIGKHLTNNRDIYSAELLQQATIVDSVVIPKRTKDNYLVIFQRFRDFSHWNFLLDQSVKYFFMTVDLGLMEKPPPNGLVAMFDMTGMGIMHLTKLRLGTLKIFFRLLQEAMPLQIRSVHVFNSTYFVDKLLAILKPLMKKELFEKLHFHQSNIDMDEFFENHIEADCVASDYGGKLPSIREMSDMTLENMKKRSEWYLIEERIRKNYRPPSKS